MGFLDKSNRAACTCRWPKQPIGRAEALLKMAGFLFATFYVAMAVAALIVELIFGGFALIPAEREASPTITSWPFAMMLSRRFLISDGRCERRRDPPVKIVFADRSWFEQLCLRMQWNIDGRPLDSRALISQ